MNSHTIGLSVLHALRRARVPILAVALTYVVGVVVGILMVHTGNQYALSRRDRLVAGAQTSAVVVADRQGDRLRAALLDFASNSLAAAADTVGGLGIIFPYPMAAYRGWVGGIVSVNGSQTSRLANPRQAIYYVSVLILQLIPYSLAGGVGVNLGLAYLRQRPSHSSEKWLGLPKEAVRDVARIYLVVLPLFLVASLWEFLSPMNL